MSAALETFPRYEHYVTVLVVQTPWSLVVRNTFIPTFRLNSDYVAVQSRWSSRRGQIMRAIC